MHIIDPLFSVFAIYFTFVGALKELPFQILMQLVTKIIIWIFNLIYFLTPKDKEYQEDETENEVKAVWSEIRSTFTTFIDSIFVICRSDSTSHLPSYFSQFVLEDLSFINIGLPTCPCLKRLGQNQNTLTCAESFILVRVSSFWTWKSHLWQFF